MCSASHVYSLDRVSTLSIRLFACLFDHLAPSSSYFFLLSLSLSLSIYLHVPFPSSPSLSLSIYLSHHMRKGHT